MAKKPKQRTFDKHGRCPICSMLFEDCPHSIVAAEKYLDQWNERSRVEHILAPLLKQMRDEMELSLAAKIEAAVAAELSRAAAGINPADPSLGW